jgi:hypothetical protein
MPSNAEEAAREFKGVWLYEFEGSAFIEGATKIPLNFDYKTAAWLDYDPSDIAPGPKYDDYDIQAGCYPIHGFKVRFIGQRAVKNYFPWLEATIKVIKMIEAKPIPGPACKRRDPPFAM